MSDTEPAIPTSQADLDVMLSQKRAKSFFTILMLCLVICVVFFCSLFVGYANITPQELVQIWMGDGNWQNTYIINKIRMPRVACAAVVGAGLAVAGMAMQALFKNPLASPSVLGISSGAAFGANLCIAFGVGAFFGSFSISIMAFICCFVTLLVVFAIATTRHGTPTILLLLAGVAVGSFFGGMTSVLQFFVDDADVLQSMVYWAMGGFSKCDWLDFKVSLLIVGIGVLMIMLESKELNLITLGDEQAKALGVNIPRMRAIVLIADALIVGGCVSISGTIGFVGLIIPHVFRTLVGPDHKYLSVICVLAGAIFLMLMDVVARSFSTIDVPIGVLTSLLGAPFFVYIMRKKKNEIW
ncbi:MAG: iron ABC transporter permease [Candidatus Methanomethylophilaceae archaeon]|nr:iron ABC transporter permease [Candidatus Methanomethylophilaceae archaeon]